MMEILLEDVRKGDELLISINSKLMYIRVLENPRLSKKRKDWRTDDFMYINVKCSLNVENKSFQYTPRWGGGLPRTYQYAWYNLTPNDHNTTKKINLNGRQLWLVKKHEEL